MPWVPVMVSPDVATGAVGATAESDVAVPDRDSVEPTAPLGRTCAWTTVAVPSLTVPTLQSNCVPLALIADGGVTPFVLHTGGMVANVPLVAVNVRRTLLTGLLA